MHARLGMRIRVSDILSLNAADLTADQILTDMSDREVNDLSAALVYASPDGRMEELSWTLSILVAEDGFITARACS